jgi:hypothetical protein
LESSDQAVDLNMIFGPLLNIINPEKQSKITKNFISQKNIKKYNEIK